MSVKFSQDHQVHDTGVCFRGLNLLGHAQMIELNLGSTCGGHGKCGMDRVILSETEQEKVNPPTQIERHHLNLQELKAGIRLACQCFPNADGLNIDVIHEIRSRQK